MTADKYLLVPASGDIDEDEGMTKDEIFQMLGMELGYSWTATVNNPKHPNYVRERCPHGMFFSGAGACPQCGGGAE